ncbi:MAG: DinB family protein [Bryobacterales bacterium]|nr:DinB family protein [Bryobacterales bacterium]
MTIGKGMAQELQQSAVSARKTLERIPEEKFDWTPHTKSMTFLKLGSHLAESLGWTKFTLETSEMDVAPADGPAWEPYVAKNSADLLETFDKNLAEAIEALNGVSDATLMETWTMKKAGEPMFSMPKLVVMRSFVLDHLVHHRAQLGLYLRLNDISVPALLGPSADEEG